MIQQCMLFTLNRHFHPSNAHSAQQQVSLVSVVSVPIPPRREMRSVLTNFKTELHIATTGWLDMQHRRP